MRSVRSHIGHMDINTDIRTDNVIFRDRFAPEKKILMHTIRFKKKQNF